MYSLKKVRIEIRVEGNEMRLKKEEKRRDEMR
jgi:hypothetical protein